LQRLVILAAGQPLDWDEVPHGSAENGADFSRDAYAHMLQDDLDQ
jgi:hypothetical protein